MTYTAPSLPAGLAINSSTGLISGTITAAAGLQLATITVSDGTNAEAAPLTWQFGAESTLTLTDPGNQSNTEGDGVSLAVAATDTVSDSGTVVWTALGLPAGLAIDPATGVISGTVSAGAAAGPATRWARRG